MNVNREIENRPVLPFDWRWVRLGEVCEIIAGQSPPGHTYRKTPDGLPFFQGKADFGKRHPIPRVWCVEPTKVAKVSDILISVRAPVGPTNVANQECCIGRGLAAIRCGNNIEMEFLLFWLKQNESNLEKKGSGSTFGAINRNDLENFDIPLPPLAEQQRIAGILNEQMGAIEKAREAAEAQLETAKTLPAAYLRQVFPKEGQELPAGWRWAKLGEICEIIAGQSPPGHTYRKAPDGLPFFQGKADFGERNPIARVWCVEPVKVAQPNDILISVRAPVGPTNVADQECCIGRGLTAIRCGNKNEMGFVLFWLKQNEKKLEKRGSGSTFGAINRNDLEDLNIPLLPLAEQKRIAAKLNENMVSAERLRADLEKQLHEINALPAALLRRAFNGEV